MKFQHGKYLWECLLNKTSALEEEMSYQIHLIVHEFRNDLHQSLHEYLEDLMVSMIDFQRSFINELSFIRSDLFSNALPYTLLISK